MKKILPGAQCIYQLLRLKELIKEGDYSPPILGVIRREKSSSSFVLFDAEDIQIKNTNGHPAIAIKQGSEQILVSAEEECALRVGVDGRGRAVFLSLIEN